MCDTRHLPAGAPRLYADAEGVDHVFVNGRAVVRDGSETGDRPGAVLHSGRDTGFGGMGFTPASQGGTHIVERNLTRLTVVVGTLFFLNSIALFQALD